MSATSWAWLVLLFPLAGSIVIGLGFKVLPTRVAGAIGTAAIALAFVCGIATLICLLGEDPEARHHASSLWDYANAAGLDIKLGIFVDPLSVFMVLVVTGVSTLIHLYSFGYMQSDEGYRRFFSYLNFFVFSMLLLVLAGNFVLLIVGWAFVGFASYALISFWYRRQTATRAGMKAFVINVVGDIGLVLAAILIFRELGTFDYQEVFAKAPEVFSTNEWTVTAICLLLLLGAFAKSAQLPLHTWLPDAMEGPTPVSALIHAATMVTAGVYLIARTHVLFVLAPTAADIAAFTGLATLLVAGTIAIAQTDLKRAIAYSTMSQIGYMIMGVSIGAYAQGLFHLMTHAFFKALLFMTAGSIISAMANRQDIDRHERLLEGDALHLDHVRDRGPGAGRLPVHLGVLLEGLDPRLRRGAGRDVHVDGDRRLRRRPPHRDLHLPARVQSAAGRALRGGPAPDRHRRAPPRAADQPDDRRGGGHRDRLPRRAPPHRRTVEADGGRDGGALRRRAVRWPNSDPGSRQRPLQLPRPGLRRLAAVRDPPHGRG